MRFSPPSNGGAPRPSEREGLIELPGRLTKRVAGENIAALKSVGPFRKPRSETEQAGGIPTADIFDIDFRQP